MEYDTILDIGKQKRESNGLNEDSLGVTTLSTGHRDEERESALFVIADGAGGHQDGDIASYIATNTVLEELSSFIASAERRRPDAAGLTMQASITDEAPDGHDLRERLTEAIDTAHREILTYAEEAKAEPMTTIVVAVVHDGFVHFAWVGDSRAYLINPIHEQISLLTRDHSVVEQMRKSGDIGDIESEVHRKGNQITRALGGNRYDDPEMKPVDVDTGSVPLFKEEILLLTSDGLIDGWTDAPKYHPKLLNSSGEEREAVEAEILDKSITDEEIRDTVLNADTLEAATESLVTIANDRGGKDNISIIVAEPGVGSASPDRLPPRGIDEEEVKVSDEETVIMESSDDTGGDAHEGSDDEASDRGDAANPDDNDGSGGTDDHETTDTDVADGVESKSLRDSVQKGANRIKDRVRESASDDRN